ncbi:MAG: NAD(P)/FAD-dependent oxidoreductase [Deltaproteobacteria bacterium]|nr:MAG: NAD(P)/FAD-dependent oxidoreductase [Deltaproteobacteria bacterium]
MADYDAIIVGAGNGGLTASLGLARAGLKTLLLEQHNIPGGCATSFVRGRFEFEVALHQLSGLGTEEFPGPLRSTLGELGVMDKLDFVRMENLYRVVMPQSLDISLKADRTVAITALKERFPKEALNIDRFFDLLYEYCMQWVSVMIMRDSEASKDKYPHYFKYTLKTTQEVFDEFFQDPQLQTTVGIYWSYLGLPPSKLPFGEFAILLWAYIEFKPWHLKGGSQALSNTLLNTYLDAGGEVRFNCGAKKIKVSEGNVTGVITEDGDEITTNRVVSNAGTVTTYVDLIGPQHVPERRLRELGARTVGTSFVSLFIGFDCEPQDMGIDHTTNFIATNTDADHTYMTAKTLNAPEYALFTCYDVDDPEFSPKGTCQASVVALSYAEPWLKVSPMQYFETKNDYAEKMLALLTQVFPDIRNHIEEIDVGTPLTHMRYLGHPGGAAYGFDQYAKDTDLFMERKSPINGLFHVGAWSGGGGFQPTLMSGHSTARAIVKTMKG